MRDIYLVHKANKALGMGKIIPAIFVSMVLGWKIINIMKPDMPDIHLMHDVNTTLLDMGKIIPAIDLKGCQLVLSH